MGVEDEVSGGLGEFLCDADDMQIIRINSEQRKLGQSLNCREEREKTCGVEVENRYRIAYHVGKC